MLQKKLEFITKLVKKSLDKPESVEENLQYVLEELELLESIAEHIDEVSPYDADLQEYCETLNRLLEEME